MKSSLSILAILFPFAALAQDGPSFDCAKAKSTAEDLICADANLAALDQRLSERFSQALDVAQNGADAKEAVADLRAMQRGWVKGRDECWKASDPRECVETAYLVREAELVTQWMLQEPFNTVTWACGGSPANEVVTMFFDTPLPSVLFERGDTIDTGTITRTASGSRYDGSFGRYIWTKGDTATYRDLDPDGTSYECVLTNER